MVANSVPDQPWWIILAFAGVMIIPLLYYLTMVVWMPRNWLERGQFLLGLTIFAIVGPFINICVTIYAVKNMDNFGWGKTMRPEWLTSEDSMKQVSTVGNACSRTLLDPDLRLRAASAA